MAVRSRAVEIGTVIAFLTIITFLFIFPALFGERCGWDNQAPIPVVPGVAQKFVSKIHILEKENVR